MLQDTRNFMVAGFFAVAIAAFGQAFADEPMRLELVTSSIQLEVDGTFAQTTEQRVRLQTATGIQQGGQMMFAYNVSMQKFAVLGAYTQKADGRKVEVAKDAIFVRDLPGTSGAPMFADMKVVLIVFPEVAVGDSLYARVRHEQVEPMFPAQYSNLFFLSPHSLVNESRITLRAPSTMALRVANEGYEEKRSESGGVVTYEWSANNTQVEPAEAGAVAPLDYSKRLSISTFPDFPAFARAYAERAEDKARPTAAIRRLADEITAGATDPHQQAKRLYDWVTGNIRYVGIFLGAGAVVPHSAEDALANRYGDCKDHVTLLTALLAAKGVDSRTALVSLGNSYWTGALPILNSFNHVIIYLPSLDVWADPTAALTPFGRLPVAVQGKKAVMTPSGEVRTTPVDGSGDNFTTRSARYEIRDNGTINAVTHISAKGFRAEAYGRTAAALTPEAAPAYVRGQTTAARYKGEGQVTFAGIADHSDNVTLTSEYKLSGGIDWPGSGAFEVPGGFRGGEHVSTQIRQNAAANKRPRVSGGVETLVEEYQIVLPRQMKIVALPKPVSFKNDVASYETTVRQEGQTITITRKLVDLYAGPVIAPSLFKAVEEKSAVIARDLRAQIVYTNE